MAGGKGGGAPAGGRGGNVAHGASGTTSVPWVNGIDVCVSKAGGREGAVIYTDAHVQAQPPAAYI